MSQHEQTQERIAPPVSQLEDVPPEEWGYWSAQAWAGCGVVVALMLAMFLPLVLSAMLGDTMGKLIGFGVSGTIALISVAIISRLTYRKRLERRETLRLVLAERKRSDDSSETHQN
jgi:Na+/melibiose symporter-like transporter